MEAAEAGVFQLAMMLVGMSCVPLGIERRLPHICGGGDAVHMAASNGRATSAKGVGASSAWPSGEFAPIIGQHRAVAIASGRT